MVTLTLSVLPWTSNLISRLTLCSIVANGQLTLLAMFISISCPYGVDCIAGLFFQSLVGLYPYLSIASIIVQVSTGLLSLLALSVVEAKPL
jgi:hypothetical protein